MRWLGWLGIGIYALIYAFAILVSFIESSLFEMDVAECLNKYPDEWNRRKYCDEFSQSSVIEKTYYGNGALILLTLMPFIYKILKHYNEKLSEIEKEIDGVTVLLLYILSFFIPLAGFIVGAIYASKDEEHYKHVGKNCLIFSVMNIVLGFIMLAALFA